MEKHDMKVQAVKDKKGLLPLLLFGFSGLLAVLIPVKVVGFLRSPSRAEELVKQAQSESSSDSNDLKDHVAKLKAVAEELKKKNLFAPAPPRTHPVSEVKAIMGSQALINDKWYKAGDRVGDAKVVAIEPTLVRIEWDGKEKVFAPIAAGGGASGGEGEGRGRPARGGETRQGGPGSVNVQRDGGGQMGGPGRGGAGMSPEERARMRERYTNMSEEERQAFREQMRARFGGRGGRGGRGEGGGERSGRARGAR